MSKKYNILHVCGSRYGYTVVCNEYAEDDIGTLSNEQINRLFARALYAGGYDHTNIKEVVHGDNHESPDGWASRWANNHSHIDNTAYTADWDSHGKAAGPIRNSEMINYLNEMEQNGRNVISISFFWDEDGKSRGTQDMINKLKSNNIDPVIFRVNKRSTRRLLFSD